MADRSRAREEARLRSMSSRDADRSFITGDTAPNGGIVQDGDYVSPRPTGDYVSPRPTGDYVSVRPAVIPGDMLAPSARIEPPELTPAQAVPPPTVYYPPQPAIKNDNMIVIDDKKIPVEICAPMSKNTKFSIGFVAASVEESEDSLSVLFRSDFSIKLPIMEPLFVKTRGETHDVRFVGGHHKFGAFTNVSFVKMPKQEEQE